MKEDLDADVKALESVEACPFCDCNTAAVAMQKLPGYDLFHFVSCGLCMARGPKRDSIRAAVFDWNLMAKRVMGTNNPGIPNDPKKQAVMP